MANKRLGDFVDRFARARTFVGQFCATRLVLLTLMLSQPLFGQERQISLAPINEPTRKLSLASVQRNGVTYVSLHDISRAMAFRTSTNTADHSFTVSTASGPVTFLPDNPFVITSNPSGNKIAIQLPSHILLWAHTLYVPVVAFAPYFEQILGVRATYESSTGMILLGTPAPPKPAFDLTAISIDAKSNGLIIRVTSNTPLDLFEALLKADGWLYVTIPNAKADVASLNRTKPTSTVKKIVATQFSSSVQLAFKLEGNFSSSEIVKDLTSNDLLITVRSPSEEPKGAIEETKRPNVSAGLDEHRKKYELDVIVLDAGHGGKDPGAIGVTGTHEKNVTLGIVLKLGKLIKQNLKDVKVVYTRDDDTFVELDRRGRIANEANGKLFISVHCNSMPRRPHPRRGFEVYVLRPGRTDEAIAIAERENSVIELEEGFEKRYQKLTDENFILVTMAQSAHMRASEMIAEVTTKEMGKRLDIPNNGVKQAGFLVLVGSAMPHAYVETAYLSNREDEALLKSQAGQEKIAEAIFHAIKRYKVEYEKLLQEGTSLGKN